MDSNHHMAAYKTASLNHWRTRGYNWLGWQDLTRDAFGLVLKCHIVITPMGKVSCYQKFYLLN